MSCKRARSTTINTSGNTFLECLHVAELTFIDPNDVEGAANVDVCLTPTGNGAIVMKKTTNGGAALAARGTNAVDLQGFVTSSGRVASGALSAILGGRQHICSGTHGVCIGGDCNDCTATDAACVGGRFNQSTADRSLSLGGQFNFATAINSLALGVQAKATHSGSLVAAASNPAADTNSWGNHTAHLHYDGGIWLNPGTTGIAYANRLRFGAPADPEQSSLDRYEEPVFSYTLTYPGWVSNLTGSLAATRIGRQITLTITSLTATSTISSANISTVTPIDARLRPAHDVSFIVTGFVDPGSTGSLIMYINTAGVIGYSLVGGGNLGGGGATVGVEAHSVTYVI